MGHTSIVYFCPDFCISKLINVANNIFSQYIINSLMPFGIACIITDSYFSCKLDQLHHLNCSRLVMNRSRPYPVDHITTFSPWVSVDHSVSQQNDVDFIFYFLPHREIRVKQDHLDPLGHRALLAPGGLQGTLAKTGPEAYQVYQWVRIFAHVGWSLMKTNKPRMIIDFPDFFFLWRILHFCKYCKTLSVKWNRISSSVKLSSVTFWIALHCPNVFSSNKTMHPRVCFTVWIYVYLVAFQHNVTFSTFSSPSHSFMCAPLVRDRRNRKSCQLCSAVKTREGSSWS